nr:hypothetical protein [Tanacetum cinerariifolium]
GGEVAGLVVAAGVGQGLVPRRVGAHLAKRKLRDGHVQHQVPGRAGHGQHQRVVAEARVGAAPGRHDGRGIGEAQADAAGFGGLPAVAAAAHPVVGVAQGHAADAVLLGQLDGAGHAGGSIGGAGAEVAVPALDEAVGFDQRRLGGGLHQARFYVAHEGGKAIEAVGIHAVAAVVGKKRGALCGLG